MFIHSHADSGRSRRKRPCRPVLEDLEVREVPSALSIAPEASSSILLYPSYQIENTPSSGTAGPCAIRPAALTQSSAPISAYGFTPQQVRTAYGVDRITFGPIVGDGSGQTIAIVDAYDDPGLVSSTNPSFATSDLAMFDKQFGLPDPPSFTKLDEFGGANYPTTDPAVSWELEEALDVEWAHAIAPQANIVLIECNSASVGDLLNAGAKTAASLPGVSVVSMSFGTTEFGSETSYDKNLVTPVGHQGVTFVASTGDSGTPGEYPAYSPNVVAVGGTSLTLNADNSYNSEVGWSGSGGGASQFETEPACQQAVQNTGMRTIPDVSFDADPGTGVDVYDSFDRANPWVQLGGTSLAAPCWAALIAIANQGRVAAGATTLDGPSQTLPAIYSLSSADFHDVTSGSNGLQATQGYDEITGLGTPVANLLVPDLAFYKISSKLVVTAQPPDSLTAGTPFGLTVAVENQAGSVLTSYNGSLSLTLQGGPARSLLGGTLTATASNGVATFSGLTLDTAGTGYTIRISTGSISTTSSPLSVTAAAPAQLVVTSQPPANVTAGTGFGLTATVEDRFGNVVTSFDGSLTVGLAADPTGDELGGSLTVAATGGVATFSGLDLTQAGSGYTLQLSSSGLTAATTGAISVSPAAASLLVVTSQPPASVLAGSAFGVTVTAYDAFGNIATGFGGNVSASVGSGPAGGVLGGTTSVAASGGVAVLSGLVLTSAPGSYTLQLSDNGLSPATTSAVAVALNESTLVVSSQPPTSLVAGQGFGITVTVYDPLGNVQSDFNGTLLMNLASGPAGGRLAGPTSVTATGGVATFSGLALTKAGSDYTF
ncbi:MAG: hypothetical protein ACP5XB_20690, partial [Isosphaeraceae bacterium]